jgi:hypothetical protein
MDSSDITLAIRCPGCGKTGMATWRERRNGGPAIRCDIVALSDGFAQNGRDRVSGDTQIVCDGCGAVVPG